MIPVSSIQALQHYTWDGSCDGWVLIDDAALSVKKERMPPGAAEALHYHEHAQQFFYILEGEATFQVEEKDIVVKEDEGLHIAAGLKHRILNYTNTSLVFLLSSQPDISGDRINV